MDDYILTDKEHHDMALLKDVPIPQFLQNESGSATFVLRKRNRKMKELLLTQINSI